MPKIINLEAEKIDQKSEMTEEQVQIFTEIMKTKGTLACTNMPQNIEKTEEHMNKRVFMTLQGKGGVGKSMISSITAQFLSEKERKVITIDTDPVNQTLGDYKAFNTTVLDLMRDGNIDPRKFDEMIEMVLSENADFVIDNGASTFIPLASYMVENDMIEFLKENDIDVYIQTIITGGQAYDDTANGFESLANSIDSKNLIVWINNYFGEAEINGKKFTETSLFKDCSDKVLGVCNIKKYSNDTFGKDMEEMLKSRQTFDEAIADERHSIMARQRLKKMKKNFYEQLEAIGI